MAAPLSLARIGVEGIRPNDVIVGRRKRKARSLKRETEAWTTLFTDATGQSPRGVVDRAVQLELDGWDGAAMVDSQWFAGDVFSVLTRTAVETSRLKLGTGTCNVATRHPSVLANAAATIQAISNGRMTLGLGRGDSSLGKIGASPTPVAEFASAVKMVRDYLRGIGVPVEDAAEMLHGAPTGLAGVAVAHAPDVSRLEWLISDLPTVDVEVTASGPKTISVAARYADRISFSVGASKVRLAWALDLAREELERSGRDPATVRFGACVPLYPHRDLAFGRELSQGSVSLLSQYSSEAYGAIEGSGSLQLNGGDEFALVGRPEHCSERLEELVEMGIDLFHFWTADSDGKAGESYRSVVEELLPLIPGRRL